MPRQGDDSQKNHVQKAFKSSALKEKGMWWTTFPSPPNKNSVMGEPNNTQIWILRPEAFQVIIAQGRRIHIWVLWSEAKDVWMGITLQ